MTSMKFRALPYDNVIYSFLLEIWFWGPTHPTFLYYFTLFTLFFKSSLMHSMSSENLKIWSKKVSGYRNGIRVWKGSQGMEKFGVLVRDCKQGYCREVVKTNRCQGWIYSIHLYLLYSKPWRTLWEAELWCGCDWAHCHCWSLLL